LAGVLLPNNQSQPLSDESVKTPSKPQTLRQPILFSCPRIAITSLTRLLSQPT
jgi:hypothetical protein